MPVDTRHPVIALCDVAQEIGSIAECNWRYQMQLANRIEADGKPVMELTVAELLALHIEETNKFNQAEKLRTT